MKAGADTRQRLEKGIISQVRFAPRRLGHVNLFVSDLPRSLAFYNEFCGIELVYRETAIETAFLSNGNSHHDVALMQATHGAKQRVGIGGHVQVSSERGRTAGLNHLGWEMEHEAALVAAYARAREAGVEIHRTTDHQLAHSVYVFDPDGNVIEFYADVLEDWRVVFNLGRQELISSKWDPTGRSPSRERHYAMMPELRRVSQAVFHPARTHHAVLVARDFDAMYDFYAEIAGLTVVHEDRARSVAVFKGAGSSWYDLVVLGPRAGLAPGLHHFALEIPDEHDLQRSLDRLADGTIGVERTLDAASKCCVFVRDPDGMLVELFHRKTASPFRPDDWAWDGAPLPHTA